jgi:transcriptional regulator with XRE-family HTH domain
MTPEQAKRLGALLRNRREELGLSTRQLAERVEFDDSTIVRFEQGAYAAPRPDKLARIADALGLTLADVYALADYAVPGDLPSFQPYLRTKYRDLPAPAVAEMERYFQRLAKKFGVDTDGPRHGEDERTPPTRTRTNTQKGGSHASDDNSRKQRR